MERIEIDVVTGEQKIVQLTPEEVAEAQAMQAKWEAEQAEIEATKQAQITAKQTAINKLKVLGLTEEEALALIVK